MNYTPIRFSNGCALVPVGAGDWRQLPFPGAELDTIVMDVPAQAQAAVIYAVTDLTYTMSPEAIGGGGVQTLGAGCVLPIYDRTQLQQFAVETTGSFVIQFFEGSTGLLPVPTPSALASGGGGGGGVTSVGATAPLASSGGVTPTISMPPVASMHVYQSTGSAWGAQTTQIGRTLYVDNVVGNDGTAQPYNPLRAYATLGAAHTAAAAGDTIIIRSPGVYDASAVSFSKVNLIGPTAQLTGPVNFAGNYLLEVRRVTGNLLIGPGNARVRTTVTGDLSRGPGVAAVNLDFSGTVTGTYIHGANLIATLNYSVLGKMFIAPSSDWPYGLVANFCVIGSLALTSPAIERTTSHGFVCNIELNHCALVTSDATCIASSGGLIAILTRGTTWAPPVTSGSLTITAQNDILV